MFPMADDDDNEDDIAARPSHAEIQEDLANSLQLRFPFGRLSYDDTRNVCFVVGTRSVSYVAALPLRKGTESNQFNLILCENKVQVRKPIVGIRSSRPLDTALMWSWLFLSKGEDLAEEHGGLLHHPPYEGNDPAEPGVRMQILPFADGCSATRRYDERSFRLELSPGVHPA
jgi:hypothetical protein